MSGIETDFSGSCSLSLTFFAIVLRNRLSIQKSNLNLPLLFVIRHLLYSLNLLNHIISSNDGHHHRQKVCHIISSDSRNERNQRNWRDLKHNKNRVAGYPHERKESTELQIEMWSVLLGLFRDQLANLVLRDVGEDRRYHKNVAHSQKSNNGSLNGSGKVVNDVVCVFDHNGFSSVDGKSSQNANGHIENSGDSISDVYRFWVVLLVLVLFDDWRDCGVYDEGKSVDGSHCKNFHS